MCGHDISRFIDIDPELESGEGDNNFASPGDIWWALEIFLAATTGEGAISIEWVEARDAAQRPTVPRMAPTTENGPAPTSGAPRLKCSP